MHEFEIKEKNESNVKKLQHPRVLPFLSPDYFYAPFLKTLDAIFKTHRTKFFSIKVLSGNYIAQFHSKSSVDRTNFTTLNFVINT